MQNGVKARRMTTATSRKFSHAAPAPVVEYIAPAPAVLYAAPAQVVEYLTPALLTIAAPVAAATVSFGSLSVEPIVFR